MAGRLLARRGEDVDVVLRIGQILVFEENDYLYGQGNLVLRLARGGAIKVRAEWLRLVGERVRWDGTTENLAGETVCQVAVRACALAEAIRKGAASPD